MKGNLSASVCGLTLSALVVSLVTACGGGNGNAPSRPNERDNPNTDYSCDFKLTEGRRSSDSVPAEISQTYFAKKFDRSWLTALKKSSSQATLDFINGVLHVPVYRTNQSSTGQCQNFAQIPLAPANLQEDWNSHLISDSGLVLSGIYLPAPKLAIIVQADSNKWTLLHEMLHHNFQLQRDRQGQPSFLQRNERLNQAQALSYAIEHKSDINPSDADGYFTQLDVLIREANAFIEDGPLEEIAVEVELRNFFRDGQMQYVPNKINSSRAYISENAKAAQDKYDILLNQYDQAVSYMTTLRFPKSAGVAAKWRQLITDRKNEIVKINAEYGIVAAAVTSAQNMTPTLHGSSIGDAVGAITSPGAEGMSKQEANCQTDTQFETFFSQWARHRVPNIK